MSLVMTEIGEIIGLTNPKIPGIAIGLAGLAMADKNGKVQYTTDVIADRQEFVESRKASPQTADTVAVNGELPFN